ncbi:MAG: TIGR00266 family protein [Polyangiales bacterium]
MEIQIRNRPSFANLWVRLIRGERIVAESDAMASMSSAIRVSTRWSGGFFSAVLRKLFGGESLFVNEFGTDSEGDLVLTQPAPGDIECLDLRGGALFLQAGAFLACDPSVQLGLGFAGLRSLIAREGLFRLRVSGQGRVWFGGYGGIVTKDLSGEYIVDSGHLLAYEPTVRLSLGLSGGIFSSLFGGEGIVMVLRGPGRIYLQSRSLEGLAAWANRHL